MSLCVYLLVLQAVAALLLALVRNVAYKLRHTFPLTPHLIKQKSLRNAYFRIAVYYSSRLRSIMTGVLPMKRKYLTDRLTPFHPSNPLVFQSTFLRYVCIVVP